MLRPRVIPCLLLRGRGLIKTVGFASPIYVGDPVNAVRIFNEKEVDEIIVLDIDATSSSTGPDVGLIEEIASEAFMPVTYGGGVRDVETMRRLFAVGVEKVSLNTAAFEQPTLLGGAAAEFGSQSVVAAIDVKRSRLRRRPSVVVRSGSKVVGNDPVAAARDLVAAGAGEVLVTSVDREGGREGLDLDLVQSITAAVDVPVIAHGGVGEVEHIASGLAAGASGVACGSMFVLRGPHRAVLISYLDDATRLALARGA